MTEEKINSPQWFQEHVPPEVANSSLFQFNIKLPDNKSYHINLIDDVDINFEILEEQHERIPAQYVYWAAIYSELRYAIAKLELKIKSRKHAIVRKMLEEFRARNIRATDKQTAVLLDGDADLVRLEAELIIQQKNCGKVYHMVEAIRLRSEHSRSLAGFKRQEREQSGRQT
jgi:hypothetical protein